MGNTPKKITFLVFFALLLIFPLITTFSNKKDFSETENRYLEEFPTFSIENILSRKYMKALESYISDHFVGRSLWISNKTKIELFAGKHESNGVYILKDRLAEKQDPIDEKEVAKSIASINRFAQENTVPVFVMLVPTSTEIYKDELPKNAPQVDEKKFINEEVYAQLDPKITALDAYNAMYSNRSDSIYYRTDHHWTTLGAYTAYAATIKKMGYGAISWGRFDIEHASNAFRGTLYSKSLYDKVEPDTIDLYYYDKGAKVTSVEINDGRETKNYDSMYFKDYLKHSAKYSVFFGTNQPVVTIKTDSEKGGKLLLFKDSYAHSYAPFLAQHYSEITMVDLRYMNTSYENLLNVSDYDQVLFLYSSATFSTETTIKKLDIKL